MFYFVWIVQLRNSHFRSYLVPHLKMNIEVRDLQRTCHCQLFWKEDKWFWNISIFYFQKIILKFFLCCSEVDDNTEYDDLDILQKDEEEKYFDADAGDERNLDNDELNDIDVENDNMDCSIHNEQCVKDSGKLQQYDKTINHVNSVSLTLSEKSDIGGIKDQSCEKS